MKHPGVKFGIISLIFTIVWTLIEHYLGYNTTNHETGQYARMLGAVVFYVMIFLAIHAARKNQNGSISFARAFGVGAIVSVVYSLGCCAWYALYGELINKDYKPTLMAFERAKLEAAGATPEAIATKMKEVDLSSGGSAISYLLLFVFMCLVGLVVALIASLVFKRSKTAVQSS